jgi:hypothetical protein
MIHLIQQMGGEYKSSLETDVTHVVSLDPTTEKCQVALKRAASGQHDIHVVMPSWVEESWEQQELLDMDEHRYPCLQGFLVSCTGFGNTQTKDLAKRIRQSGGEFSADLSASCTHLIANRREGEKYKFAQRKGMVIVHENWLIECMKWRQALPTDKYLMSAPAGAAPMEERVGVQALPGDYAADSTQSWALDLPGSQQAGGTHFEGVKMAFGSDVDDKLRKELVTACRAGAGSSVAQGGKLRSVTHFIARGPLLSESDSQALKVTPISVHTSSL